jgi:hypothetical protein
VRVLGGWTPSSISSGSRRQIGIVTNFVAFGDVGIFDDTDAQHDLLVFTRLARLLVDLAERNRGLASTALCTRTAIETRLRQRKPFQ